MLNILWIHRYCRNLFDRDYKATIGVDFEFERFVILDQEFNMQMWVVTEQMWIEISEVKK